MVFSYGVDSTSLAVTKQLKDGGSHLQSESEKWHGGNDPLVHSISPLNKWPKAQQPSQIPKR
jgi:hypothetical protein